MGIEVLLLIRLEIVDVFNGVEDFPGLTAATAGRGGVAE